MPFSEVCVSTPRLWSIHSLHPSKFGDVAIVWGSGAKRTRRIPLQIEIVGTSNCSRCPGHKQGEFQSSGSSLRWNTPIGVVLSSPSGFSTLGWVGDISWHLGRAVCWHFSKHCPKKRRCFPLCVLIFWLNRLKNQHKWSRTYNHYHEPWINMNQHKLAEIWVRDLMMQFAFLKFEFSRFRFLRSSEWESGGKTEGNLHTVVLLPLKGEL